MFDNFNTFLSGSFIVGYFFAVLALYFITALIQWKIFVKAGEQGWKAVIPIYNSYIEYRLFWKTRWFFIPLIAACIGSFLMWIPFLGIIIFIISSLIAFVISAVLNIQKSRAFGKEDIFAVGLILLPLLFNLILAFDSSEYSSPQPDPDFISNISFDKQNNQETVYNPIDNVDTPIEPNIDDVGEQVEEEDILSTEYTIVSTTVEDDGCTIEIN
jgi:hypothetical protein